MVVAGSSETLTSTGLHDVTSRYSNLNIYRRKDINSNVRFVVFTAVTMKSAVFRDVAQSNSCANRRFGGSYRLYLQGTNICERGTSVSKLLQLFPQARSSLADSFILKM
jgi:hypothetical protein